MKLFLITAALLFTTHAQAWNEMLSCYGHTGPQATDATTFTNDVEIEADRIRTDLIAKTYQVIKDSKFDVKVTLGFPYEELMMSLTYKGMTMMTKGHFFDGAELVLVDPISQVIQISVLCVVE